MGSKTVLLLVLLVAMVLISPEMVAMDLGETTATADTSKEAEVGRMQYNGGYCRCPRSCRYGCCHGGHGVRPCTCCLKPAKQELTNHD